MTLAAYADAYADAYAAVVGSVAPEFGGVAFFAPEFGGFRRLTGPAVALMLIS